MVTFVEVTYGAEISYPPPRSTNMGVIIGKSSVIPSPNPYRISNASDLIASGIPSTSQLYKACNDFIGGKGDSNATIWAYAVASAGAQTAITDVALTQIPGTDWTTPVPGGTYQTFMSPYVPTLSISGVEVNYDNSGWYTQDRLYDNDNDAFFTSREAGVPNLVWGTGTTDGVFDGRLIFLSGGFVYSGVNAWGGKNDDHGGGAFSGHAFDPSRDSIRADITIETSGVSDAFNILSDSDYDFNIFTFGYDHSLSCPTNPVGASAFKYASGQCYASSGWLHDVKQGKNMAQQFNSVGKRCVFYFSLPSNVRENTKMTGYAVTVGGNAYTGAHTYGDLTTILGNTYYMAGFVDKQGTDGADIAAVAMGASLAQLPRTPLMYTPQPANVAQTVYPQKNEVIAWRSAKVNPLIKINRNTLKTYHFGGNSTFGSGNEKDINFVRCRALLANMLIDDLQSLLITRKLKYDLAGINSIKNMIIATEKSALSKGYIDGIGKVTIPIESYLVQEDSLGAEELITLNSARQSKRVEDISITFKWSGDIEEIIIRSLASS
jgi:hypothetical protein